MLTAKRLHVRCELLAEPDISYSARDLIFFLVVSDARSIDLSCKPLPRQELLGISPALAIAISELGLARVGKISVSGDFSQWGFYLAKKKGERTRTQSSPKEKTQPLPFPRQPIPITPTTTPPPQTARPLGKISPLMGDNDPRAKRERK